MLLIGSRALVFRAPFILQRDPKDFDFISTKTEALGWMGENGIDDIEEERGKLISRTPPPCEFEISDGKPSSQMLIDIVENDPKTIKTPFGLVPNFNILFALKASHRYLKNSPHFWKTAFDYHRMKAAGATILPEHMEWFKLREKETYSYKHPNLNVKKNDFFKDDNISYKFDHDSIHESVKIGDRPAYTYYQKDGSEVLCDKQKFFDCPFDVRINGVMEEAAVLAVERSLVPHPDKMTPKQAWHFALSKVCSSITSGWFREFAYENIFEACKRYENYGYWERFQAGLESGVVKPFEGKGME